MKTNEPFITDAVVRRDVYRVFRLTPAQADQANVLTADDVVSRQSVTVRDAKSLGLKGDSRYVVVEGSEAAVARATELLKGIPPLKGAEAEETLDPGMEDEGCETIEHERTWAALIEERRGRGPKVFEPTRVRVPDPAERGYT